MHIEPVLPSQFEYVKVRRTGGILGVDQLLHVDQHLRGTVEDRHFGDRVFHLDACSAQELMAAVTTLMASTPDASPRRGADLFHYDIEIASGGVVHHFNSVDLGADEALHGVMLAANRLLQDRDPIHPMTLHTTPAESGVTA